MFSETLGDFYFLCLSVVISIWLVVEAFLFYRITQTQKSFSHSFSALIIFISYVLTFAFTLYALSNQVFIFTFDFLKWLGLIMISLGCLLRIIIFFTTSYLFVENISFEKVGRYSKIQGKGIYRFIRFPQYLGIFIITWGLGLSFNNMISLFYAFIIVTLCLLYRIYIEEQQRKKWFGTSYADYQSRTKRVFPFIF